MVPMATQAERSAATRTRLLDATVECLVELGWSGTSTTEVVRRAGVSRGAQVHHYPSKDDLVLAATEHLLHRRLAEYRTAFDALPSEQRTPAAAFELLWTNCFSGATFTAWLELAVASRTDPALQARVVDVQSRFNEDTVAQFQTMFPAAAADPDFARMALRFTFCVLDGLALSRLVGASPDELAEVRAAFTAVTAPFLPVPAEVP
jgi:AcrR family transcriptional regulator